MASSREAHDRIVITPGAREDFTGAWKVDAFRFVVNQMLIRGDEFKQVGRGEYALKG